MTAKKKDHTLRKKNGNKKIIIERQCEVINSSQEWTPAALAPAASIDKNAVDAAAHSRAPKVFVDITPRPAGK